MQTTRNRSNHWQALTDQRVEGGDKAGVDSVVEEHEEEAEQLSPSQAEVVDGGCETKYHVLCGWGARWNLLLYTNRVKWGFQFLAKSHGHKGLQGNNNCYNSLIDKKLEI